MCRSARKAGKESRRNRLTCNNAMHPVKAFVLPALCLSTLLCACVTMPSGPGVLVLPGEGKSFEAFHADNEICKQFAQGQIGGQTPNDVATNSGVRSAALGTVLGAVAGAAIDNGNGAAIGAGTGLAIGSLAGTSAGESSSALLQQRYDFGYMQCMYLKGNRVPVASSGLTSDFFYSQRHERYAAPPPPTAAPPSR